MGLRRRVFREPHICSWLRIRPPWEEEKREYRQIYTYIGFWSMRAIAALWSAMWCNGERSHGNFGFPSAARSSEFQSRDGLNMQPNSNWRIQWSLARAVPQKLDRIGLLNFQTRQWGYKGPFLGIKARRGWHVEECRLLATFLTSEWNVWYQDRRKSFKNSRILEPARKERVLHFFCILTCLNTCTQFLYDEP